MNIYRRASAHRVRYEAADMAADRPHKRHIANGDETRFRHGPDDPTDDKPEREGKPSYFMSFTKGLPHDPDTGLLNDPDNYPRFIRGIDSGDPRDFRDTPLAHEDNFMGWIEPFEWDSIKAMDTDEKGEPVIKVRGWESSAAGNTYDLEGPDAQAVTMPPAPALGSDELTAEMAEIYSQALLRDVRLTNLSAGTMTDSDGLTLTQSLVDELNNLPWFQQIPASLPENERNRHRSALFPHTAFRGQTEGDLVGPYISQFLLVGNPSINGVDNESIDNVTNRTFQSGLISYGAQVIDQRVRVAISKDDAEAAKQMDPEAKIFADHMTSWNEWLDAQNGADFRNLEQYRDDPARRFITTARDLATFVHYDALYQAYLNACLILLGNGSPFDPGIPYQAPDNLDHQQGFAHFGGPHILSLVTEVATRALKAVRYQKFNVHRRARPEVLAARIHRAGMLGANSPELTKTLTELETKTNILSLIEQHNQMVNSSKIVDDPDGGPTRISEQGPTRLLPMAFCEGSPMHPAYGAGHATVAGACTTLLKAFFDHGQPLALNENNDPAVAWVPNADGSELEPATVMAPDENDPSMTVQASLTVEGELNKLASNISIGRNWAGVHYYTDYIESLRMGEQIAIGLLEEQKLTYGENFSMTVPLYDGGTIRI